MNGRILLFLLLILLTAWGASQLIFPKGPIPFRTEIIEMDTAAVTSLEVERPVKEAPFSLKKVDGQWFAIQEGLTVAARGAAVSQLLKNFTLIRSSKIVAKEQEAWKKYGVSNENGYRIRVFAGQELLDDVIIGRAAADGGKMPPALFLRIAGENEVYAIENIRDSVIRWGFQDFRDRSLIRIPDSVQPVAFEHSFGDTTILVEQGAGGWATGGQQLDSAQVEAYFHKIRYLKSTHFADDFDELQAAHLPSEELVILGNSQGEAYRITAYMDSTRTLPFIIHSSQNPGSYFGSDSTGLYQMLFTAFQYLLPSED